ncbi:MAG: dihydroorotate dehydrogenase electron transfer subunit [Erysipelotrichaceae bacterium]|nr:dihydroorotate dehydrogenase electron transfer subunit [Erysipelotrichaceae bacterium]
MKQVVLTIKENVKIAKDVYKMRLLGDSLENIKAGQFVNIKLKELYLRRPISVCEVDGNELTIIYKAVGEGTKYLSTLRENHKLDVLIELGNGYDLSFTQNKVVLIGGGVGVPPMYEACKQLLKLNKEVTVVLGFNTKDEIFYEEEFKNLGVKTLVTTADGSYGHKGFVTDVLDEVDFEYFITCGPEPMLKAVYKKTTVDGQMSFERRMGCGFGACMGCSCKTITGYKRICKEGPVMRKDEILWEG